MDFMISHFCDEQNHQPLFKTRKETINEGEKKTLLRVAEDHSSDSDTENHLPPEEELGNIEYKAKLVNPTTSRLEHLKTQMKWRLREGQGEAIYEMEEEAKTGPVNWVSFTQDAKAMSVGCKEGYLLYGLKDILNQTVLPYEGEKTIPVKNCMIVERLFSSSLIVLVSLDEPRMMHVYHSTTKNLICHYKFNKSVLNVKLNRKRIIAVLEDSIYIHGLSDMKQIHTIMDTPTNTLGVIDLSCHGEVSLLAYPGSLDTGSVHIFDTINLSSVHTFVAHDNQLAALKFNSDVSKIGTASVKGTVIRVYSIPRGQRLFEFRRGMSRCVQIHSLAFSPDSLYLCSSSNTETIHVFKLVESEEEDKKEEPKPETTSTWYNMLTNYIPNNMPVSEPRSFATAKLPAAVKKSVTAIPMLSREPYVLVATTDGFLYSYKVDPNGGDLSTFKQWRVGPGVEGAKHNIGWYARLILINPGNQRKIR